MKGNKMYLCKYYMALVIFIVFVALAIGILIAAVKIFGDSFAGGLLTGIVMCGIGFVLGYAVIPDMIEYLSLYHASLNELHHASFNEGTKWIDTPQEPSKSDTVILRDYGTTCPLGGTATRERCDYCGHCKGEYAGISAKCEILKLTEL